jgi:hypothetical protein
MRFDQRPRFEVLENGHVVARAGSQLNCGGIAAVAVQLLAKPEHKFFIFSPG